MIQYNTGKTSYSGTIRQRGLLLALKIAIFGQLCLFPISKIHNIVIIAYTDYNPIYDGDWSAFAVHCNVYHGKWKKDGKSTVRVVRMRMTLRGFKDLDAGWMQTFAGTSSRIGQRLVASEAAIRGWHMVALDVKKAFLKGITYKQLAEVTGEPERDVCFNTLLRLMVSTNVGSRRI